uniref:Putative secreted protein n=1 Tax=Anopheles darlingi TaxID=43151 RepID=A0A2M4DBP2_ANODA
MVVRVLRVAICVVKVRGAARGITIQATRQSKPCRTRTKIEGTTRYHIGRFKGNGRRFGSAAGMVTCTCTAAGSTTDITSYG